MSSYSTSDLSWMSGGIIAEALRHPVAITQRNKPRLVMLSVEHHKRLTEREHTRKGCTLETMPDDLLEAVERTLEADERHGKD